MPGHSVAMRTPTPPAAAAPPPVVPTELSAGWLHLRPWRAGDEPAVLAAGADPEVVRWTSIPQPYTEQIATAYVSRETADGWAAGTSLTWAVCESTTGEVLADVALRRQSDPAIWDIGFWCLPAARGRGVVPSAVGVVCRWAFAELGAARVEWRAFVGNTASRRAAEKAGFQFEGTGRSALVHRGRRVDCWVAALLPDDPQAG